MLLHFLKVVSSHETLQEQSVGTLALHHLEVGVCAVELPLLVPEAEVVQQLLDGTGLYEFLVIKVFEQ